MNKSDIIKPGIQKPTVNSCASSTAISLGLKRAVIKRKPRTLGLKYNREEDKVRTDIIKELRKKGYKVRRVEPFVRGKFSLADLYVWKRDKFMAWLEVKSSSGVLSPGQLEFQEDCISCKIHYHVVRSVEQALDIVRLL